MAILHGMVPIQHVGSWSLSHIQPVGLGLLCGLLEMVAGALLIAGLWMWVAAMGILILVGLPLSRPLSLQSLMTVHAQTLFRMIVTFASALAGPGKASLSK
jgi:uncharacterized membrane protein YphA (DoxX/SURF4 family)